MVRIAISQAAFEAIAKSLPFGAPCARRTRRKGETAMVRSRVLLSAIFATLSVALAGCAAPFSRGYYAGGYPYGIHGYYCGAWSVWPGVSCVDVGPPERVYPRPADP
jgi:hypothetical protein